MNKKIIGGAVVLIVVALGIFGYTNLMKKSVPVNVRVDDQAGVLAAINAMVQATDSLIKEGVLKRQRTEVDLDGPTPNTKEIYSKKDGTVLRYNKGISTEDSMVEYTFDYDDAGRLVYAFISGAAINDSEFEHEIYFDGKGGRISESHLLTQGPGYSWPEVWEESNIIYDALADFSAR